VIDKGISRIGSPVKEIESAMEGAGRVAVSRLERGIGLLSLFAKLAPMFGFIGTIIGVIKDFHYESLHQKLGPLNLRLGDFASLASFKIDAADSRSLISQIEKAWKSMAPGMPFSYRFMSDSYNDMYRSEQRAGTIALVFSSLAILIACLGLFGLATYMAEQRTKEIGIRKVLGASVSNVAAMLSKDFLLLVAIAAVPAFPLAWWAMNKWLQDFAYRVSISPWVFAAAGIAALLIALLTVSFQAIKAAVANPVKSLRTE
jgi:putative ABC transport system permease protein